MELAAGETPPEPGTLVLLAPVQRLASDLWTARILGDYGREDDVAVQEELVKLNHEVPRDFPAGVLAEVQHLPSGPTPEDMRSFTLSPILKACVVLMLGSCAFMALFLPLACAGATPGLYP